MNKFADEADSKDKKLKITAKTQRRKVLFSSTFFSAPLRLCGKKETFESASIGMFFY
jgi:hypothetical protein